MIRCKECKEIRLILNCFRFAVCFYSVPGRPTRKHWKMAQMTMIARVVDGLPLVGTMQEDEQVRAIIGVERDDEI